MRKLPKIEQCINDIIVVVDTFQSTQNLELVGKLDVVLKSVPELLASIKNGVEELKELVVSTATSTNIPTDANVAENNKYDNNTTTSSY